MNEMSESMDKKSFLMMAAYIAETATDQVIVDHLETSIKKYQQAKVQKDEEKMKSAFMEITILSYVNVVRMIDKKASDLIKDMENVDRVFDLIKPNTN